MTPEDSAQRIASVLLVDDSLDLLNLLKITVELHCGCRAVTASKFSEVKSQSKDVFTCRLAILDINLGHNEPNGVDVYLWLRTNGFSGTIAFLTGHAANHPLVAEAAKLGDARVFNKPLSASELLRLVKGELNA